MSIPRYLVIRRLFAKSFEPKSLFYLAYKCARLQGLDLNVLPKSILKQQYQLDTEIIKCGEDMDHTIAKLQLLNWNWSIQNRLPFQLFLAVMCTTEIPEWIDETMQVVAVYYFKELINLPDPYDTDELNDWNLNARKPKTLWRICKFCKETTEDIDNYRFICNRSIFIEDAEDIILRLQNEKTWCDICHTCPLITLHNAYGKRSKFEYSSSDSE